MLVQMECSNLKKNAFILFLFVTIYGYSQNQNLKVTYTLTALKAKDTSSAVSFKEKMKNRIYARMQEYPVELKIESGVYAVFNDKDETMEVDNQRKFVDKMVKIALGLKKAIYYDLRNNSVYEVKELDSKDYFVKKNIYNWQLIDQSKLINGFLCYRAKTTYSYIDRNGNSNSWPIDAWYCPELPYGIGPKGFSGVPGLILELTEADFFKYNLVDIKFSDSTNFFVKMPDLNTANIITNTEYDSLVKSKPNKFGSELRN